MNPINPLVEVFKNNPAMYARISTPLSTEDRRTAAAEVATELKKYKITVTAEDLIDPQSGQVHLDIARNVITAPKDGKGFLKGWRNQGNTTIPCPMISTLFNIGALKSTDGHINTADLESALRDVLKLDPSLIGFFMAGTRKAEFKRLGAMDDAALAKIGMTTRPATWEEITSVDVFRLVKGPLGNGPLDHRKDLKVLTDKGFNKKAFEDVKKFAALTPPNDSLTSGELATMAAAAAKNDPDIPGDAVPTVTWKKNAAGPGKHYTVNYEKYDKALAENVLTPQQEVGERFKALFEMAMLLQIFGKGQGADRTLSLAALESIYLRHELPKGFEGATADTSVGEKASATGRGSGILGIASMMMMVQGTLSPEQLSIFEAIGKPVDPAAANFKSLGTGVCPFMNQPGPDVNTQKDIAEAHQSLEQAVPEN